MTCRSEHPDVVLSCARVHLLALLQRYHAFFLHVSAMHVQAPNPRISHPASMAFSTNHLVPRSSDEQFACP